MELPHFPPPDPPANASWMIVFADLLSLMLTFFVLMFSMNAVQVSEWRAVVDALSDRLNPAEARLRDTPWEGYEQVKTDAVHAQDVEYLATLLSDQLARDDVLRRAQVRLLDDRVAISIPAELLFTSGSAKIGDSAAFDAVARLAAVLRNLENEIMVVGYTDPSPVEATQYPSHWELSLSRALAVARILKQNGYRQPVPVYGYGANRFGDIMKDLPVEIQSRLSRRVDVIIRDYEQGAGR